GTQAQLFANINPHLSFNPVFAGTGKWQRVWGTWAYSRITSGNRVAGVDIRTNITSLSPEVFVDAVMLEVGMGPPTSWVLGGETGAPSLLKYDPRIVDPG